MSKVIHRYVRNPNLHSHIYNRVANRFDPFKNTLVQLQDPQRNRKLYLIGTTNSSTTLAYRTKKLLNEIKPASLYVQTTPLWWNHAKHIQLESQTEWNQIAHQLPVQAYKWQNNLRSILFRLRLASWVTGMKILSRFPSDFNFWTPGLQMKFALEQAEKIGANINFGGSMVDPITISELRYQPDLYFHTAFWRTRIFGRGMNTLGRQVKDFYNVLHARGGQAFAQSFDRSRANFVVSLLNRVAPKQKKIFVDSRDDRIFRDIWDLKGDSIVAVVNQWHMEGVQTYWRDATGTQIKKEEISPIADMDIDSFQQKSTINDYLRDFTSQLTQSEPATYRDYITNYHKENFQFQRTRHVNPVTHQDVPAPGQQKKSGHH